LQINFKQESQ